MLDYRRHGLFTLTSEQTETDGNRWLESSVHRFSIGGNPALTMYSSYIMKNSSELSRTQIYLTQQQQLQLAQVSCGSAATKSALIRQAIDQFLAQQPKTCVTDKTQHLQSIFGLWAQRDDMKDPASVVLQLRQPRYMTTKS
ncbi:MAG: hypothetical protein Q8R67_00135 [Rhodoferax sp.]|nr:hypothetical protein [Rhodoferax sp.]MDP3650063.1 hypothetical protein [Rhodoferax sp.]